MRLYKKIFYSKQFLDDDDIKGVTNILRGQYLTQGPAILKFEQKIAKYVGSKYAVAVSNCTAGLHIACKAAGLNKSNHLITSSITFVSSPNAALFLGSSVKFTDIDDNINMCSTDLLKKINKSTKVIMPVHMSGLSANHKEIYKIAKSKKKIVIEDAAHSFGGYYNFRKKEKIGSCKYSDMTVFSFHPVKNMTTGEGGVITTNNKNYFKKLLELRSHGINKLEPKFQIKSQAYSKKKINKWYYEMQDLGFNYRMTDIQASLGITQLKKLNKFIKKRRDICKVYDKFFLSKKNINLVQSSFRNQSANHLYVLRFNFKNLKKNRNQLMNFLEKEKIVTQVHYIPVVMHPYYKKRGFNINNYPKAKKYYEECLSIPCFYQLPNKTQVFIMNLIEKFCK